MQLSTRLVAVALETKATRAVTNSPSMSFFKYEILVICEILVIFLLCSRKLVKLRSVQKSLCQALILLILGKQLRESQGL